MALQATVNIPRDSTVQETNEILKQLIQLQKASIVASGNAGAIDNLYNGFVRDAKSVEEVNALFRRWWHDNWGATVGTDNAARQDLLQRWFGSVLNDERVHGVKFPLFHTSAAVIGELTDDSVGLSCTPSTESAANRDDFAYLPQFWCVEVAMERNADGTHTITRVEHIDSTEDVRSGKYGLCQVLQKNTWVKEWKDANYHYMQMCCDPADKTGWHTWPQGTSRTGTMYTYIANPKYVAGIGADGVYTCGTGLAPCNWTSHNNGVTNWRKRGAHYSGAAGNLLKWQLAMIWLKYARKGNSGTIEGCSSYNLQYTAAVSETGVKRILLTAAQAGNLYVGSSVQLGDNTSGDRNAASAYNICRNRRITAITDAAVGGTTYKAVYVDTGTAFDTVAGKTMISTDPYYSGWNDTVKGYDGSRYNYTNGKEPGLIQRTEFQVGAYLIVSDELWQWGQDASGNCVFDCFTCHNQSKVTTNGAISADYTKQEDLTLTFPAGTKAWWYIEDLAIGNDPGVLWPSKVSTAAGSGTGVKAGFYVGAATSDVRAAWCLGYLINSGNAGLAARSSHHGPPPAHWNGVVGAPSGISG